MSDDPNLDPCPKLKEKKKTCYVLQSWIFYLEGSTVLWSLEKVLYDALRIKIQAFLGRRTNMNYNKISFFVGSEPTEGLDPVMIPDPHSEMYIKFMNSPEQQLKLNGEE
jgi:hypothetical protein